MLSVTLIASISCTKPSEADTKVSKPPTTISIDPKSGKAGTKFDISCNNLGGKGQVTLKVLQADGTLVIDRANTSDNSSTFSTSISTFGFNPSHYQCQLEDSEGKLLASDEFDVTGTRKTIFEDDFSNGNSGWSVFSGDKGSASYDTFNGEPVYHITSSLWTCCPAQMLGNVGNFVAEVDCWPDPSSPNTTVCEMIFRYVVENNEYTWNNLSFYAFGVPGTSGVIKVLNGKIVGLVNSTYSDSSRKGKPNHLKVACNGSTIECYINGLQVLTGEDSTRGRKRLYWFSGSGNQA